jgi:hypothetical protein
MEKNKTFYVGTFFKSYDFRDKQTIQICYVMCSFPNLCRLLICSFNKTQTVSGIPQTPCIGLFIAQLKKYSFKANTKSHIAQENLQ